MKCTNKIIAFILMFSLCIGCSGCKKSDQAETYDLYETSYQYGITHTQMSNSSDFFSKDLCVSTGTDLHTDTVESSVAKGAGLFNVSSKEVLYAQNINEKLYPASTTKIMTALLAIKYGDLDQEFTVSKNAVALDDSSSVCHLKEGDVITLRQLLYGLMMRSGNDAAIAIAEGMAGSMENFADMMNEEAISLGATNTHFVNSNGLPDDNHYTSVYDMYLIFNEAIKYDAFVDILCTTTYNAHYTRADGQQANQTWNTTNQYLLNKVKTPKGITVLGGKTGTTGDAGYCLVLLSRNNNNEPIISIVFGADCKANLYYLMSQMLQEYGNET